MMFSKIAAVCLVASSASGFAPQQHMAFRPATTLFSSRVERADAIKAAVATAKEFGASSPEARVAWEAVEEIAESDISASYTGGVNPEECEATEVPDPSCIEYEQKLDELQKLLDEETARFERVKNLAEEIKAVKMVATPDVSPMADSPALQEALAAAKAISAEKGASSPEAKLAWEALEEQASMDMENALGGMLTDECLTETIEACEAMEELSRAINLSKSGSRYSG